MLPHGTRADKSGRDINGGIDRSVDGLFFSQYGGRKGHSCRER